jgi:TRAP-type C4-dicarboxylate transport system permease small subunit
VTRFSRWITLPLGSMSGAIVFALMVLTVLDIVLRKMSGQGVAGVIEYSEVFLVAGVFFAFAAAQVEGFHVSTSVLTSRMPTAARRVVEAMGALMGAIIVGIMAYVATQAAWVSFVTGEYRFGLAEVVVWPARAAVALGLWLYLIEYAGNALNRFKNPEDEDNSADAIAKAEKGLVL